MGFVSLCSRTEFGRKEKQVGSGVFCPELPELIHTAEMFRLCLGTPSFV